MERAFFKDTLIWLPEKGIGFFPVQDFPYDQIYFGKYEGYAETERGHKITETRIDLVDRYYDGYLIDVGVGCGQFVLNRPKTKGFDVNPAAIRWLKDRGLWEDFYGGDGYKAISFWDSLEHIEFPEKAVGLAAEWVFVSLPVFRDCGHVLKSKHFRKDEHFWYFTESGLILWFEGQGFFLVESNKQEQKLGREDIMSFVFRRHNA